MREVVNLIKVKLLKYDEDVLKQIGTATQSQQYTKDT